MTLQRDLLQIYFTPAPYCLYREANRAGNMAYAGIGLGLINSQTIFWIANCGTALSIYYNSTNVLFIVILVYLYYHSLSKSMYLLSLYVRN